jgi:hypothetical protein
MTNALPSESLDVHRAKVLLPGHILYMTPRRETIHTKRRARPRPDSIQPSAAKSPRKSGRVPHVRISVHGPKKMGGAQQSLFPNPTQESPLCLPPSPLSFPERVTLRSFRVFCISHQLYFKPPNQAVILESSRPVPAGGGICNFSLTPGGQ